MLKYQISAQHFSKLYKIRKMTDKIFLECLEKLPELETELIESFKKQVPVHKLFSDFISIYSNKQL